ncbi:MAG: outer membrane protein assembly factor BamE [Betaproteobacteria bacterium]|nr:outer membrane protein assembly factor BamE [Betaproteobacteria bacterium]
MSRLTAALCAVLSALGLSACDWFAMKELKPGISTGYDVRERMGTPTLEWRNEDGSLTWEFARTPEGKVNYLITVGPDNIMRSIEQVVTEANFARVQAGMSRDQIRRLLGRPAHVQKLGLKQEEVWEWKYDNPHNADMRFYVHFDIEGRVVTTSRREEPKG